MQTSHPCGRHDASRRSSDATTAAVRHSRRTRIRAHLLLLVVGTLLSGAVAPALAQPLAGAPGRDRLPSEHQRFYVALNVLIGATRTGIAAWREDRPVRPALLAGAAAGLVMYSGMRLTGNPSLPAVLGNQVTAVGASVARAAASGEPLLSDLTFPLYPVVVRVRPKTADPVQIRLSAMATAYLTAWTLFPRRGARLDWESSLRSGTVVVRSSWRHVWAEGQPEDLRCQNIACPGATSGSHRNGVLLIGTQDGGGARDRRILAHEAVHVGQQTRDLVLYAEPIGDALARRMGPLGRAAARVFVLDVVQPIRLINMGTALFGGGPLSRDNLFEREAEFMTGFTHCGHYQGAGCRW